MLIEPDLRWLSCRQEGTRLKPLLRRAKREGLGKKLPERVEEEYRACIDLTSECAVTLGAVPLGSPLEF